MPKVDLADKPICITGASSGIGRATALACANAGMPVVAAARREDKLNTLVDEIRTAGGRAEAVATDVTNDDDCAAMVEKCLDSFGSIYAVYANAGYGYEAAHHDSTPEQVRDIFETNVFGTLNAIDAALPHLLDKGSGHILVCSSCLSALPTPYYGAYSATKSAQHHLASAMRFELRPRNIHVSTVHPVGTKTEFFDEAAKRSETTRFLSSTDGPFMQPPERVANAIVRALRRPKPEVWTSHTARILFTLSALTPKTRDRALRLAARKRLKK